MYNPSIEQLAGLANEAISNGDFESGAMFLNEIAKRDIQILRGNPITYANILACGGFWSTMTRLLPFGTNSLVEIGWINSLVKRAPVNAIDEPLPWYTYPAIDFLEPRVKSHWNVFEWGCGNSSLWWSKRVHSVCSVEHDKDWFQVIYKQRQRNGRLSLVTDERDYVDAISSHSQESGHLFDVIVIDGEWRNACARRAPDYLSNDGIIVFDNTDRVMFEDGSNFLTNAGFMRIDFTGLIPSYLYRNCTSVFFKNTGIISAIPHPASQITCLGPTCAQAMGE